MDDEALTAEFGKNGWKPELYVDLPVWFYVSRASDHPLLIPENTYVSHPWEFLKDYTGIRITNGYHALKEERLTQRQLVVRPLVDAFFAYLKQNEVNVPKSGKTREAFTYALNQERYLRVFLEDGDVPIDNHNHRLSPTS